MQQALTDLLAKRRDRAIAIILGVKERDCDSHLPPEARSKLRKVILDQINEFYEMAMDITRSLDTGDVTFNELYLEKLDALHSDVTLLVEAALRGVA